MLYAHDFESLWDFWMQGFYGYIVIDYALQQALGSDYHTYLQDWNGLYQVSPQFLSQVIRKQKIALTSHTLYGSSRLGVKQYMPGQFYAQWDYTGTVPALDTAFLTQRLPWYSHAQNDVITPAAEDPVGHSDTSIYAVQHQRGMLQYELTNHLGNVQATVSDGRVPNWVGTDSVSYYKPAIAAAYDYYPFGMLMPGRYVQDTSSKCMTISSNKWMTQPVSYCKNASSSWPWYPIVLNSGVGISFSGGMPVLNFSGMNAVLQLHIPKGSSSLTHQRTFSLELLGSVSGVMFALVSQSDSGSFTFFQQQISGSNPVVNMPFVPLGHPNEQIMLYMIGMYPGTFFAIQQACLTEDEQQLQTVLVDVCTDAGDRYPFGFNGMLKDNELKGIGNSLDFGARMLDTRVGRWLALDPLVAKYPSLSPYGFVANNPVRFIDPDGRIIDVSKLSKANMEIYNSLISNLNKSHIFKYVYNNMENSDRVFTIDFSDEFNYGGQFNPNNGVITIGSKEPYIVAQEFFHGFQYDNKSRLYNGEPSSASLETEGDLFGTYIFFDIESPGPKIGEWGEEIISEFGGIYSLPTVKEIKSPKYKQKFREAVDNRIKYYKEELKGGNLSEGDIEGYIEGKGSDPNALIDAFEGGEKLKENENNKYK